MGSLGVNATVARVVAGGHPSITCEDTIRCVLVRLGRSVSMGWEGYRSRLSVLGILTNPAAKPPDVLP